MPSYFVQARSKLIDRFFKKVIMLIVLLISLIDFSKIIKKRPLILEAFVWFYWIMCFLVSTYSVKPLLHTNLIYSINLFIVEDIQFMLSKCNIRKLYLYDCGFKKYSKYSLDLLLSILSVRNLRVSKVIISLLVPKIALLNIEQSGELSIWLITKSVMDS